MPSTYTLNNGIELIGTGEQSGTWGDTTNTNLGLLDVALDGQVTVALASAGSSGSPNSLPISDGTASNGRNRMVVFSDSGDLGATAYVQLTPNDAEKIIYIRNSLSGSRSVILFQGTYNASNDYEVPAGTTAVVYFDGAGAGAVAANVFNNAYFDGLRLGSVSVTAILDEDNMASDSATALATQQSIKAYVDSQVGTVDTLAEILANGNTTGSTDIAVDSAQKVQFRDAAIYINSSVDGQLDIVADTEIQIAATTVDLNGNLDVSGTLGVTGVLTATSLDISGDIDVDGTTNLDVVDIDGATQIDATVTVGVDDTGYDVKFFGATAGAYMLWDESADDLILGGAAGLSVNSTALVTGVLTTTAATVFNGGFASNAASTIATTDNSVNLTLTSTDADDSGGPKMNFYRNSASPAAGDILTQIGHQGKNDAGETVSYMYQNWRAAAVGDGAESGQFDINTYTAGTAYERLGIDPTETVFNQDHADLDFRVESDTLTSALFVDGGTGNVTMQGATTTIGAGLALTNVEFRLSGVDGKASRIKFSDGVTDRWLIGQGAASETTAFELYNSSGTIALKFDRTTNVATFASGAVFNEDGIDADFRVESDTNANMLFVDGGSNKVIIGASSSTSPTSVDLVVAGSIHAGYADDIAMSYQPGTYSNYYKGMTGKNPSTDSGRGLHIFNYDNDSDSGINFWSGSSESASLYQIATFGAGGTGEVIFNPEDLDRNFRVKSVNNDHMLFVDAGGDHVNIGIGTDYGGTLNVATTDTSVNLVLASEDAGAGAGPILDFHRNSSSPADNDVTGQIRFRAENDTDEVITYAEIVTVSSDVSNASEDSTMYIQSMVAGTVREKISMFPTETVLNNNGVDLDFRVESDTNANMLVVDASTNRVGVGVAAPLQTLHVAGSVFSSSGYYITVLQGNAQLTNASTSSGSNASYIGQGLITVVVSDAKAKENFGAVEENECLNKIVSLADHVKKFDWIDEDWKREKGRTVGMVAQEVYEDHSEFVHKPENYNDDGWAIRYQEIVPTLIKAFQEQQATITALTARITALENA
jgi:hypothetical protein